MVERVLRSYCKALEALCAALMAAMVVLVFGNVILRYLFNSGWLLSEEMSRWMFVWMVFMGAVVVMRERSHMGTDMVVARLPDWAKRGCLVLVQLVMLYITWLICKGGWTQVVVNRDVEAPVTGYSVSIFYFSGVMFGVSTLFILAHQLWLTVSGKLSDAELVMVQESEEPANHVLSPSGAPTDAPK